jgi:hypothetical protein
MSATNRIRDLDRIRDLGWSNPERRNRSRFFFRSRFFDP